MQGTGETDALKYSLYPHGTSVDKTNSLTFLTKEKKLSLIIYT